MFLPHSACLCSALSEEDEEGLLAAGFPVTSQDLDCALAELQEAHSEALGAPKVSPSPADIGGVLTFFLHDWEKVVFLRSAISYLWTC